MPLSEHEQKLLDQLEQQLNADDPQFASSMAADTHQTGSVYSVRNLVFGVLIVLVGLAVIITGVASKLTLVGVAGFALAGLGVYLATQKKKGDVRPGQQGSGRPVSVKKTSSFMQNLESRWDERRNQGL